MDIRPLLVVTMHVKQLLLLFTRQSEPRLSPAGFTPGLIRVAAQQGGSGGDQTLRVAKWEFLTI